MSCFVKEQFEKCNRPYILSLYILHNIVHHRHDFKIVLHDKKRLVLKH